MTKQEKIEGAYGNYWFSLKDFVSENGWCSTRRRIDFDFIKTEIELDIREYNWRPLSLNGIEDNNGWVKINCLNDIPKEKFLCVIGFLSKNNFEYGYEEEKTPDKLKRLWLDGQITHFKKTTKLLPPLF